MFCGGLSLHVCSMHHVLLPRIITLGGRPANAPLIYLCTCLVALLRCFGAHSAHNTCTEPCAEIDVGLDSRGWSGFGSAACRQYAGETALARQTETWLESLLPASSSVPERLQVTVGCLIRGPIFYLWRPSGSQFSFLFTLRALVAWICLPFLKMC